MADMTLNLGNLGDEWVSLPHGDHRLEAPSTRFTAIVLPGMALASLVFWAGLWAVVA